MNEYYFLELGTYVKVKIGAFIRIKRKSSCYDVFIFIQKGKMKKIVQTWTDYSRKKKIKSCFFNFISIFYFLHFDFRP